MTFSTSQKSPRVLAPLALPSPDLTHPLCPEMGKRCLKAQKGKSQPRIIFKGEANLQYGRKQPSFGGLTVGAGMLVRYFTLKKK